MTKRARTRVLMLLLAVVTTVLLVSVAAAEALVVVRVRGQRGGSSDGVVTLSSRGSGRTYSCQTRRGTCQINGVSGGSYFVRFAPRRGQAPPPRTVMVPPEGTVTLVVSAAAAR